VSSPARKPPLWLRIGFAIFAAGVALGLAEIALQILDIPSGGFSPWVRNELTAYRYAPHLDTRLRRLPEYDVSFQTNADGLRDDPLGPAGRPRVLLLGDSFTSGYGVERGESFADLAERELGVDVVNAGVGGWELVHQAHYAREAIDRYDPTLVVYALYLGNDLALNGEWEVVGGSLRSLTKTFPLRPPVDLKLRALIRQARYGLRERNAREAGEWTPFPEYLGLTFKQLDEVGKARWELARKWMGALDDAVAAAGRDLFVVTFPYRTAVEPAAGRDFFGQSPDLVDTVDFKLAESRAHSMLVELGVDFAPLGPALRSVAERVDNPLMYFPIDGHWNRRGHEVVAETLVPLVRARLSAIAADRLRTPETAAVTH
jgi:hypothetical protein